MMIGDHDFDSAIDGYDLTEPEENRQAFKKIINSKRTSQIEKHNDHQYLYGYGDKIVLLNVTRGTVDYYVKLEQGNFKLTGKYITQVEVWRSSNVPVHGVVEKVFFDHILKSHDTVLSDSLQTNDGRRLWVNLVGYAFEKNKFVYVVDLNTGTIIPVKNSNTYADTIQNFYDATKSAKEVRIMISNVDC